MAERRRPIERKEKLNDMKETNTQQVMSQTLGFHYGALADSLSEQITQQGMKFNKEKVERFEKLLDCLQHIRFGSILTDSAYDACLKKLHKQIIAHVAKENNRNVIK